MQVPDKNASMESLVSTLILSGILPVLTLAASLCTNHSLYYQGCTNLPNSLHIDFGGCLSRLQLESIMSMCVHQLDIFLSKLSSAMTDWWIGVLADTPGGWGRGEGGGGVKWKIRSFLSFLVTHSPCSFHWPECLLFHCGPLMLTNKGHRLNPNV